MATAPQIGLAAIDSIDSSMANKLTEQGRSILIKGPSGVGKTTLACTWPTPAAFAYFDTNRQTVLDEMRRGKDVKLFFPKDWREYSEVFVAGVKNRQLKVNTIVIDTIDMAASRLLWPHLQGAKVRLTMEDFGRGLNSLVNTTNDLLSACHNRHDGSHYYHVVMCCHERDITDEAGALLRVAPAIMGAFKDIVESLFDTVLLGKASLVSENKLVDGRTVSIPTKKFTYYTVSPDNYHTAKGVGLPPIVKGDYENLLECWNSSLPAAPGQVTEPSK